MRVVVVGAGKMGLPLACQIADRGAEVVACDINTSVVARINAGDCPIDEPGVAEMLRRTVGAGRLRASTATGEEAAAADVVVVIVPAVLTDDSDIDSGALESVSEILAMSVRPGCLVSFETTLPVGGTRNRLLPRLEAGGLKAGVDFDLAFSPERVKSQFVLRNLTVNPKVVGGVTPASAARAEEFYRTYLGAPVDNVGTLEAAEMVKLAGMLYRDVNIALANELAGYAEEVGVDLTQLFGAINSDGEAQLLQPGIGVGGHCTPVYPYFLIRDAERRGVPMSLAARSRRINDQQAARALDRVEQAGVHLEGAAVLVMGLAFRPDVKESIFSTAFLLQEELRARGATVTLSDPLYTDEEIRRLGFVPASPDDRHDVVVLNTAHAAYLDPDFSSMAARGVRVVLDGRNAWSAEAARDAGLLHLGVGQPLRVERRTPPLPIARPVLGTDEELDAADVVRSGWLLQGRQVAALEEEFAAFTGAARACAVSSGTAALHLALLALGVGPGDEVVTVSHSFVATANAVVLTGATPVFVDVEPEGFNVDTRLLEGAITPRTRALLVVHQYGMPCDVEAVLRTARCHGLPVVEDAACAIGSEIRSEAGEWQRIGAPHGDVATFSFHPRKVMTTGEGGMVVTGSAELDAAVRRLRQHGAGPAGVEQVGFNYRMTDVQAAIGRRQLRRVPEMVVERRRLADLYSELLAGRGVTVPEEPSWARSNWQSYCLLLEPGFDVARVLDGLRLAGIEARGGIPNAHQQPAYAHRRVTGLVHSEAAAERGLCLPLFPGMDDEDLQRVAAALVRVLDEVREVER